MMMMARSREGGTFGDLLPSCAQHERGAAAIAQSYIIREPCYTHAARAFRVCGKLHWYIYVLYIYTCIAIGTARVGRVYIRISLALSAGVACARVRVINDVGGARDEGYTQTQTRAAHIFGCGLTSSRDPCIYM